MSYPNIVLAIAAFLGLIYLGLAIAAFRYIKEENRINEVQHLLAFTFWWPFYDVYTSSVNQRAKLTRQPG
jgi:hypothetical protein